MKNFAPKVFFGFDFLGVPESYILPKKTLQIDASYVLSNDLGCGSNTFMVFTSKGVSKNLQIPRVFNCERNSEFKIFPYSKMTFTSTQTHY